MGMTGSVFAQDYAKGDRAVNAGDYATALKEWRFLAEAGDVRAQLDLGDLGTSYGSNCGVHMDCKEALSWYRKAAAQGDLTAQNRLGFMYEHARGIVQDYKEAVSWYRKAAEQGHAGSQHNLGMMYVNGRGVVKDPKEAVSWYLKAAEQGLASAQGELGFMMKDGKGVIKDPVSAHMWFNISAANGDDIAGNDRDELEKKMTAADISKAQELARACVKKEYKSC